MSDLRICNSTNKQLADKAISIRCFSCDTFLELGFHCFKIQMVCRLIKYQKIGSLVSIVTATQSSSQLQSQQNYEFVIHTMVMKFYLPLWVLSLDSSARKQLRAVERYRKQAPTSMKGWQLKPLRRKN